MLARFENWGTSGGGASLGGWIFLGIILPLRLMFRLDWEGSNDPDKTGDESIG